MTGQTWTGRLMLLAMVCGVSLAVSATAQPVAPEHDALRQAWGLLDGDPPTLGYSPKGYWTRYPDPADIPFANLAFSDLLADPLVLYDFTANMAAATRDHLSPEAVASSEQHLLRGVYFTGVRHATAEARAYSASLWSELPDDDPLIAAVREIYRSTGRVWRFNAMNEPADFPLPEAETRRVLTGLDSRLHRPLAEAVVHVLRAYEWAWKARRNTDPADLQSVWRIRRLGETQFDGLEYHPELEDAARSMDMPSVYHAGSKLLAAGWRLTHDLDSLRHVHPDLAWSGQHLDLLTPMGRIVVTGSGDDRIDATDACLIVDLGGDDTWTGPAGATPAIDRPVALAVDLAGNDEYRASHEAWPAQGAGIAGAGVLIDVSGDDHYAARRLAQGSALLGYGVLADLDGNDRYDLATSGQGSGYFGVGVALDLTGDDHYRIHGDGQGYGGVGGVGTLVNRSGNDVYLAVPAVSDSVYRPDYHAEDGSLNYSYAQGCGIGRRGDITDGHSWAGGMGTLIDLEGDDEYVSANWSLGCGYWYGMGFLYDGSGDDLYRAAAWSSGAGAHFAIGVHIDDGGDDEVHLWEEKGYGIGFGHDVTVALHLNQGGDDLYRVRGDGLGYAINLSQAFFIDTGGNDHYVTGDDGRNYGHTNWERYDPPASTSFFHLFGDQVALFLDGAGLDRYDRVTFPDGPPARDTRIGDGRVHLVPTPAQRDSASTPNDVGIGWDRDEMEAARSELWRWKLTR